MKKTYVVVWDNGASASGTFSERFDSYEDADAFGRDWEFESNVRDFGTDDPVSGYSYEVVECEDEGELSDNEKDAHEGAEHIRMRDHERP